MVCEVTATDWQLCERGCLFYVLRATVRAMDLCCENHSKTMIVYRSRQ